MQQQKDLPRQVDAVHLAEEGTEVAGTVALALLPRLAANLAGSQGQVQVQLRFSRDAKKRCLATGTLESELQVLCQRCLEPMVFRLQLLAEWCLVQDDAEAKLVPRQLEPVLTSADGRLELHHALEDEMLLGLPSVCLHQPGDCQLPERYIHPQEQSGLHRPFAALAQQDDDRSP